MKIPMNLPHHVQRSAALNMTSRVISELQIYRSPLAINVIGPETHISVLLVQTVISVTPK